MTRRGEVVRTAHRVLRAGLCPPEANKAYPVSNIARIGLLSSSSGLSIDWTSLSADIELLIESLIFCVNRLPEHLVMIGSERAETHENRRT